MATCTGEVIVVMSGDDVSLPNRISRVVEVFAAQPRCMVVCSDWTVIDQTGAEIPGRGCHVLTSRAFRYKEKMKHIYGGAPVCGAAAAYRATLRDIFGPMHKGHHAEDNCYWFRGLLMGEVHYLARPLVLWRSHEENQSNWDRSQNTDKARAKYFHFLRKHQNFTPQWKRDLAIAHRNSLITAESMQRIGQAVQFDREWQRLRRYSLACVPMKLWNAAAKRVLLTRPNLKVFRKTISQMHIRLSASRRTPGSSCDRKRSGLDCSALNNAAPSCAGSLSRSSVSPSSHCRSSSSHCSTCISVSSITAAAAAAAANAGAISTSSGRSAPVPRRRRQHKYRSFILACLVGLLPAILESPRS
jgi:hypothetical protein